MPKYVLLLLLSTICVRAATLSVVVQDEHGSPVPARIYLTDTQNLPVFPEGVIRYDSERIGVKEQHFVPPSGKFSVTVRPGTYTIVVERGKEYLPVTEAIQVSGDVSRTIRLVRWVKMADRGWYSADMHVHRPLADLAALMEAEDLTTVLPITRWRTGAEIREDPDLGAFLPNPGSIFSVLNEELEPHGSALLASRLPPSGVPLEYPMAQFGLAVKSAGGVSDSEKATALELPALAAIGAVQTVGLANNHLWRSGSNVLPWGAWPDHMLKTYPQTCTGFVQAGFDMYSALLNAGIPVKLSAGSASGVHPVPVGWSRVYVRSRPEPEDWFAALKAGKSFVTSGPMLLLRVSGRQPGEEFPVSQLPARLDVEVEMLSLRPVGSAEVVTNGAVTQVGLKADPHTPYRYWGRVRLKASNSSWVTARWTASRGNTCDAAHTSPVYVRHGDDPIPVSLSDSLALYKLVDNLIQRVTESPNDRDITTGSEEVRRRTLEYLRKAAEFYRKPTMAASYWSR